MKKGLSHIEIIFSFVIFVGAIGFALYFFSPTKTSRLVDSSLDYVEREISENTSVLLKTYSVKVNNTQDEFGAGQLTKNPCSNTLGITIENVCDNTENKIIVDNSSGGRLDAKIGTGQDASCNNPNDEEVFVKNENWKVPEDFIYIKISEDFNLTNSAGVGNPPQCQFYQISTSSIKTLFSEKRILFLNKTYYENYFGLKEQFNLPGRVNFGFSFVFENKKIEAEKNVPSGLDVFSTIKRVEVLRESGEVEYADFTMKVW